MGRRRSILPVPQRWREGEPTPPRRSIRLRLTALYTSVLVFSSAALLTIAYLLAHETLTQRHPYREALLRLGLHPAAGQSYGLRSGSKTAKVVHVVAEQIATSGAASAARRLRDRVRGGRAVLGRRRLAAGRAVARAAARDHRHRAAGLRREPRRADRPRRAR